MDDKILNEKSGEIRLKGTRGGGHYQKSRKVTEGCAGHETATGDQIKIKMDMG